MLRTGVSEKEEEEEGEGEGEGEEEGEEGLVEVEKPSGGTDYGGNDRSHPGKERWTAEDSDAEVSGSSTNESERELDQETSDSSEQESDHIVSDAGACGRETNTGQVSKPRKTKKCQTVQEKGVGMVRKNVESNEAAVLSESVSRSLPLESAFVGALSASSHSLANHSRTTAKVILLLLALSSGTFDDTLAFLNRTHLLYKGPACQYGHFCPFVWVAIYCAIHGSLYSWHRYTWVSVAWCSAFSY